MSALNGKWTQTGSEKMEDYLKEVGLGMIKRKLVLALSPVMDISIDGNKVNIKTCTTFSSQEMSFTVGEDFETDMPGICDGKFNASAVMDGDKMIVTAVPSTATIKGTTTTREIVGEQLVMTMVCGAVECKRFFKKTE